MTTKKKEFDFLKDALLPACTIFCIMVLIFFLVAMSVGINVTETETEINTTFDDLTGVLQEHASAKQPDALPVQTLLGIFLFCMSVALAGQVFRLNYNKMLLRMLHLGIVLVAFLIFILLMPGYLSEAGAPAAMLSSTGVTVIYFLLLGIKKLIVPPIKKIGDRAVIRAIAFMTPAFAIFTLLVFFFSTFNLISQVNVIVIEVIEKVWINDDVLQSTYARVATPLAPTLQNYLRYLASGIVFMVGYAVLKMNLNPVIKGFLNFAILTSGYLGIWVFGMHYFSMFTAHTVPAVVAYLAVYLVALIAVCVVRFVKRKKRDDEEEYDSQFMPGRG